MTESRRARRTNAAWLNAAIAVLCVGVALTMVSGATVLDRLWFVEDAVPLEAPGRYRVTAARASTWTLLQELGPDGALTPVRAKVYSVQGDAVVEVTRSAASYQYSRAGAQGFSAYDFALPSAGAYEVELVASSAVSMRLLDDVQGRLATARRGLLRTAALAAGALALALAFIAIAWLIPARRPRARVVAPRARVSQAQRRSLGRSPRSLEVLPALPTSIALERYNLPAPKRPPAARPRGRPDTARVPSVA